MKWLCLLLLFIASFANAEVKIGESKGGSRDHYLEKGQVWRKQDIPNLNILLGPHNEISVLPGTEIRCHYVEWKKLPSGASPKFICKLEGKGDTVRIKYGRDNREIFAEVLASRLFWALGFYSDDVYAVKIDCIGCPENDPFKPEKSEPRIERNFAYAMMERNYPGYILEDHDDQGWAWKELEKVKPEKGGASAEQISALVLLAVFVQHGDQKPEQQRIGCNKEDVLYSGKKKKKMKAECTRPILMVQDLGSTFGRADQFTSQQAKMEFDLWSNKPVWNLSEEASYFQKTGHKVCIGNLIGSATARQEGLDNPVISEAGRKFLADELVQLSDSQIEDLFRSGRADETGEEISVDGVNRPVSIDDWVQAFKKKRQEIVERNCTPM
jgi:hypothetical protein